MASRLDQEGVENGFWIAGTEPGTLETAAQGVSNPQGQARVGAWAQWAPGKRDGRPARKPWIDPGMKGESQYVPYSTAGTRSKRTTGDSVPS